jgi:hypothetical protein
MTITLTKTTEAPIQVTDIVIDSQLIVDYLAQNPNQDHTLTLNVSYLCETATAIPLTTANLNIGTANYTLTPDALGQTTALSDGIYHLELVKTPTNPLVDVVKETYCLYIYQETQCCLLDYLSKFPSSDLYKFHELLLIANECSDCQCTDACRMYKYLASKLGIIIDDKTSGCGCS